MKRFIALVLVSLVVALSSCSEQHADLPTEFAFTPPPTPTNLSAVPGPERCTLSWSYPAEALPLISEFRVYEYYGDYDLLQLVGTTSETTFVDTLLIGNLYYCYKVSAVDANGIEGWRTEDECAFVTTQP